MTYYPDFFDAAPVITLHDPLAQFLGAVDGGIMEYRYLDAVRLTGHSCPTVARAFLMTRAALSALYADKLPVRGEIQVGFRDGLPDGTTGVVANVVGLITGAAGPSGFKGLGSRFHRSGLLRFDTHIDEEIRFLRTDNSTAVTVTANLGRVPASARTRELLRLCLTGNASQEQQTDFRNLWQARVRTLLLECADDPAVIGVSRIATAPTLDFHQGCTVAVGAS